MFKFRVLDALDIETTFLAKDEEEGKRLGIALLRSLGFESGDVVFAERRGSFVRVRLRAYIYRPGERYGWLSGSDGR